MRSARKECGELIWAAERAAVRWEKVRELRDVVVGTVPGRPREGAIALFESQGLAMEDVAAAYYLYKKAGEGMPQLPF